MTNENEQKIPTPEDLRKTLEAAEATVLNFSAGQRWAGHRVEGDSDQEWREHVAKQIAALGAVIQAQTELLGGLSIVVAAQGAQNKPGGMGGKLKALLDGANTLLEFGLKALTVRDKLLGR